MIPILLVKPRVRFVCIVKSWMFLFSILLPVTHVIAQTPVNYTGWYGYEGYHAFREGNPWGLMGEAYWIRDEVILKQNALFARVGLNYYLPSGNRINAGVAYQYNYPYDAASKPYNWPDYRLFQQYLIRISRPKGLWQFRFRVEERWLGRKTDPAQSTFDYYKYETSVILMAKKSFNLGEKYYAVVYDEIWLVFNPSDRILDQNRAYLGFGMNLDEKKEWRLEFGYMNQPNFTGSPDTNEKARINHALRVTLTSDIPFRRGGASKKNKFLKELKTL
ncbi:MAG TPA: DUF2490 domain-containing protein [Cytophaga sp.]|jgi:hypothetical protein|nr:DUF2490 domain-containing protein [Cytophaga sp.]